MSIPSNFNPMGAGLPYGFRRLRCITSTGEQIIDTDAIFRDNPIKVELECSIPEEISGGIGFSSRRGDIFDF